MTKFEQYRNALITAGFEDSDSLTYNIFDGDELPEHETLTWRDGDDISNKYKAVSSQYKFRNVESEGGGEGEGEYCYGIIELDGTFYKAEWSYYSYNGCDYDYINDTIKEVKPVQKMITVYE
ncbi:hypothetical protein VPHK406_0140 [Vibrio phage K406]